MAPRGPGCPPSFSTGQALGPPALAVWPGFPLLAAGRPQLKARWPLPARAWLGAAAGHRWGRQFRAQAPEQRQSPCSPAVHTPRPPAQQTSPREP